MGRLKKFFYLFSVSFVIAVVPVNGYVKGAWAFPAAVGSWEILQTILLSLGVTVTVQDSSLVDGICSDLIDTYNLWLKDNGFDDKAQLKQDLADMLVSAEDSVISVSEEIWNGLRSWVRSLAKGETKLLDNASRVGFNRARSLSYEMMTDYKGGTILHKGHMAYDVSVPRYGVVGYSHGVGDDAYAYDAIVFATEPFTVTGTGIGSYSWKSLPSDGSDLPYENFNRVYYRDSVKTSSGRLYYCVLGVLSYLSRSYSFSLPYIYTGANFKSSLNRALSVLENDWLDLDDPDGLAYGVEGSGTLHDSWDVATPGRQWDGETLTGDVTLTVPGGISDLVEDVAVGELSIPEALPGAIPVDTVADEAIYAPDSIADVLERLEAGEDARPGGKDEADSEAVPNDQLDGAFMVEGLRDVFPFCIPFDVYDFVRILSAPAQAPHFKFPVRYPLGNSWGVYEIDIDLSKFDSVAELMRKGETLLFIVGLAMVTRNIIRG